MAFKIVLYWKTNKNRMKECVSELLINNESRSWKVETSFEPVNRIIRGKINIQMNNKIKIKSTNQINGHNEKCITQQRSQPDFHEIPIELHISNSNVRYVNCAIREWIRKCFDDQRTSLIAMSSTKLMIIHGMYIYVFLNISDDVSTLKCADFIEVSNWKLSIESARLFNCKDILIIIITEHVIWMCVSLWFVIMHGVLLRIHDIFDF